MTTVFSYRTRAGNVSADATVGSPVVFDEQTDYILVFPAAVSPLVAERIGALGGEMIRSDTAMLNFKNFVGRADLAGIPIDVRSSKIGDDGVSRLLQDVSELGSALVFGSQGRTTFGALADQSHRAPVPYHQFQFLRRALLGRSPGDRMQDWFGTIERSPTRHFEPDRPIVPPNRVRKLDHRAVASIFSRIDRLTPVLENAPIADSRLSKALTFGNPPRPHFPVKIAAPRGRLSFDTFENRFVKHVVGECLSIVQRFVDHPRFHASLRRECRSMLTTLATLADASFLAEVGRITRFQAPSQALAKGEGYRELFSFWTELTQHMSLPLHPAEATQFLDGRDVAGLYEYWTFAKIVECVVQVSGAVPVGPASVNRDEFGENLILGLKLPVGTGVTIRFNPTFSRRNGSAYSTPLRPDVVVETANGHHAFDAKYRLTRLDVGDNDTDDGNILTYKRADLYKMHTYRDAINGVQSAFAVYPGSEFVFFERLGVRRDDPASIATLDGVGAIPLRPNDADPIPALKAVLAKLLAAPAAA